MSEHVLEKEYKLDSIYIIEARCEDNSIVRGTCFSISENLLLTAYHVINGSNELRIYLSSDSYDAEEYITAECIYFNEEYDIAILQLSNELLDNFITLYSTSVSIDNEVKSCGYPLEKDYYYAPINVKVTNTFEKSNSRQFTFEVSQSNTISNYRGMSGSPIMYDNSCIGLLLVQQGKNTLYSISIMDLLNDPKFNSIIQEYNINIIVQIGIDYQPPKHPKSPFKYCLSCHAEHPSIKGIDIGFVFQQWNIGSFTETVHDWIIDYCLTQKEQANFKGGQRSLFKHARSNYPDNNLDALGDLCLHMAIRESYKTIPIINKVFDMKNKTFSCTHAVLNFDSLELWIGASSVSVSIEEGIQSAITSINYISEIQSLKNRLFMLNSEIDKSWPHKDKLERLSNSTLDLDKRFDKIIIPIFIMHNSELISSYDEKNFMKLFNEHAQSCRELLKRDLEDCSVDFINLRVFYFPVADIEQLNSALLEELHS